MPKRKSTLWKIIGLELLILVFYTINGVYSSITEPESPVLQFIGLVPLALGILILPLMLIISVIIILLLAMKA